MSNVIREQLRDHSRLVIMNIRVIASIMNNAVINTKIYEENDINKLLQNMKMFHIIVGSLYKCRLSKVFILFMTFIK